MIFMAMNTKYLFYERSKLLNESLISLHENVFPSFANLWKDHFD